MTPKQKLILESAASLLVAGISTALYVYRVATTKKPVAEEDVYYAIGFVVGAFNAIRSSGKAGEMRGQEGLPHRIVIQRPTTPPMTVQDNDVRLWVDRVHSREAEINR